MTNPLDEFEQYIINRWGDPGEPDTPKFDHLVYLSACLMGESAEVWGIVKKKYKNGIPLDRRALKLELGDVLHYLIRLAQRLNIPLEDIMESNIEKLKKRDRGE